MPRPGTPTNDAAATGANAHWQRLDALWLGLLLVAAVALRVREAIRAPMWFDEIYTWWVARGGPFEAIGIAARDVHPPLHFVLLGTWGLAGDATLWLRSLSILFGLAAIVITFLMTRDMFGRGAAFIAAALLVIHPMHIYFSQEVRSYALLWILLPSAWWFMWRWVRYDRRRDAVLYAVSAVLALYTHYFAGFVLALGGAWGLAVLLREPKRLSQWLAWNGVVVLAFAPQVPTLLAQIERQSGAHWMSGTSPRALIDWTRHVSFSALYMVPVIAGAAALPLLRSRQRHTAILLVLLAAVPPLVLWWLTTRGAHLYAERYMYYMLPAATALVGAGIAGLPHRVLQWAPALLLIAFGVRAVSLRPPMPESTNLKSALERIEASAQRGDTIFAADVHSLFFVMHYAPGFASVKLVRAEEALHYYDGAAVVPFDARVDHERFDGHRGRWWALHTHHGGDSGERAVEQFRRDARRATQTYGETTLWGPEEHP